MKQKYKYIMQQHYLKEPNIKLDEKIINFNNEITSEMINSLAEEKEISINQAKQELMRALLINFNNAMFYFLTETKEGKNINSKKELMKAINITANPVAIIIRNSPEIKQLLADRDGTTEKLAKKEAKEKLTDEERKQITHESLVAGQKKRREREAIEKALKPKEIKIEKTNAEKRLEFHKNSFEVSNNKFSTEIRKEFVKNNLSKEKFAKILINEVQKTHSLLSRKRIEQLTGINKKYFPQILVTLSLPLLGNNSVMFDFLTKDELHRLQMKILYFSAKNVKRIRRDFNVANNTIAEMYKINGKMFYKVEKSFNIEKLTKEQQYQIKTETQAKNLQEKYGEGIVNPFQVEHVKNKISKTMNEKYGGFGMGSDKLRAKIEQTNIERFNVRNPFENKEIINKIQRKVWNHNAGYYFKKQINKRVFSNEKYVELLLKHLYKKNNNKKIKIETIIMRNPIYDYVTIWNFLKEHKDLKDKYVTYSGSYSIIEYILADLLEQNNIEYEMHVHILPKPYRRTHFDFLISKQKLLIELNPTNTHDLSYKDRFNVGERIWKFKQAERFGYTLLNLYDPNCQPKNAIKEVLKAIDNIDNGLTLHSDYVSYKGNKNNNDNSSYNEGYTWWE